MFKHKQLNKMNTSKNNVALIYIIIIRLNIEMIEKYNLLR